MEIGLGPYEFDCSGLVLAAISKAAGIDVTDWPHDLRHVRQMYELRDRDTEQETFAPGNLIVFGSRYDIDGESKVVPAHIGIAISVSSEELTFLHAFDRKERVIRQRMDPIYSRRMMGVLTVDHFIN